MNLKPLIPFDLKGNVDGTQDEVPVKISKKSKGQLFKERHGHSLTMSKNLSKFALRENIRDRLKHEDILLLYRKDRAKKKRAIKKIQQKRHEDSALYMRTKGKTRKTKHKGRTSSGAAKFPYSAPTLNENDKE